MMRYESKRLIVGVPLVFAAISWVGGVFLYELGYDGAFANNGFYYFNVITQLPSFTLGCVLYTEKDRDAGSRLPNVLIGAVLIFSSAGCYWLGLDQKLMFFYLIMSSMFTYGIYFICRTFELEGKIENKNVLHKVVMWFGKNSYYIFLAHSFFVWSMPAVVFMVIEKLGIAVNSTVMYIILLPVVFVGAALLGEIFRRICDPVCKKLNGINVMDRNFIGLDK